LIRFISLAALLLLWQIGAWLSDPRRLPGPMAVFEKIYEEAVSGALFSNLAITLARVVAAFQNVSAAHLQDLAHDVACDVLMCGDDAEAKGEVAQLVEAIPGMRAVDAGPLANAVASEALTPVLLYINRRYKVAGAGIRITGLE